MDESDVRWDQRFLSMAELVAGWSKDPSTKCGAVLVDPLRRVVSIGFNGLPRGVADTIERLENREVKYELIIHAERNAILFARQSLLGCTLYTWPFMPCSVCASMVVQVGIARCVAPDSNNPRWTQSFTLSKAIFQEAGVELFLC